MSKFAPHIRSSNNPRATSTTVCQKCLGTGHFTYQCKSTRPYISRPSRTQQLENPHVLAKLKADGKPSVEVPEEFKDQSGTANKILEAKEKQRAANEESTGEPSRKRRKRSSNSSSDSDSDSDSDSSSSESDSDTGSSDSGSSRSPSRSRERDSKRRAPRQRSNSYGSDRARGRSESIERDREAGGSRRR